MKKRITAALLAALLCLLTAAPALAAEPAALTEATGAELEQTIASMLDACITEGLFGPEKQSVTREASFVYRSDESYGAASRTVHDTLRILVNSEDVEQKPYSVDAWKRIVPADHDPILEIRAEGFAPGRRWSYSYLNGGGNLSGRSDPSVTSGYRIDVSVTCHRSAGDFVDRLAEMAAQARAAAPDAAGRLAYVNDLLIRDYSYDYQSAAVGGLTNSVADFLETGKGICGSYANTVSYLCLFLGIPCVLLHTEAPGVASHAWNCVCVDGAWKELDVTFNETEGRSRGYFLVDSIGGAMHDWRSYDNGEIVQSAKETALDLAARLAGTPAPAPDPDPAPVPDPAPAPDPAPEGIRVKCGETYVQWTDAEPFIDANDRTMVPLRAVAAALGLDVLWDAAAREAVFSGGGKSIAFPIGSAEARTESGTVEMDTAAVIVNERTYAPVRYLAEHFGHTVGWDEAERTVLIG